jgi:hypothetical protein
LTPFYLSFEVRSAIAYWAWATAIPYPGTIITYLLFTSNSPTC